MVAGKECYPAHESPPDRRLEESRTGQSGARAFDLPKVNRVYISCHFEDYFTQTRNKSDPKTSLVELKPSLLRRLGLA